jgi:hypothetical protein
MAAPNTADARKHRRKRVVGHSESPRCAASFQITFRRLVLALRKHSVRVQDPNVDLDQSGVELAKATIKMRQSRSGKRRRQPNAAEFRCGSKSEKLNASICFPLCPQQRTSSDHGGMSELCHTQTSRFVRPLRRQYPRTVGAEGRANAAVVLILCDITRRSPKRDCDTPARGECQRLTVGDVNGQHAHRLRASNKRTA